MIRRSPAEAYIQYLILHPRKYDNVQIREILTFAQLDSLGNWYIDRLRDGLVPPQPFFPFDSGHIPSRRFLLLNGLAQLFSPDEAGRKAFKILERPRAKEFVESMLITHAPSEAIVRALVRMQNFRCTALAIDRYKAFFWNVDLLDSTELRALLQLRFNQLANDPDSDKKAQADCLKRAYWADARKTAADLPFSPISALLAQMKMGVMPSTLDVVKVIENARGVAALRASEAVLNGGKGDDHRAMNLSIVLEKMTNVLKEVVRPDDELRQDLSAIALRTDEGAIPTVHMLSSDGSSFTTDVGPKEIAHELPADVDDGESSTGDPETTG